jgi:hypothetical protein
MTFGNIAIAGFMSEWVVLIAINSIEVGCVEDDGISFVHKIEVVIGLHIDRVT